MDESIETYLYGGFFVDYQSRLKFAALSQAFRPSNRPLLTLARMRRSKSFGALILFLAT
jgi:hypothetical protein